MSADTCENSSEPGASLPLLAIEGLSVHFQLPAGPLKAVDGVSLSVAAGETLALVGESGCGKSVTASSILRLVPHPGAIVAGSIRFDGRDIMTLSPEEIRALRGGQIGMIFQEPMTSLNPVFRIGEQIAESMTAHGLMGRGEALEAAAALLARVGIPSPAERIRAYPHELSGGMRQRVMIAMSIACGPRLLIADEPTTALDVTIQAQIMALLNELRISSGMGMLLITHDLGIVSQHAQRTAVMYAGQIVEQGPTDQLLASPRHPYTRGLIASLPSTTPPGTPIETIAGAPPPPWALPPGCPFQERCPLVEDVCRVKLPPLSERVPGHAVRCWMAP
jgi:peptide/nickel transport system ATP-binding protein